MEIQSLTAFLRRGFPVEPQRQLQNFQHRAVMTLFCFDTKSRPGATVISKILKVIQSQTSFFPTISDTLLLLILELHLITKPWRLLNQYKVAHTACRSSCPQPLQISFPLPIVNATYPPRLFSMLPIAF